MASSQYCTNVMRQPLYLANLKWVVSQGSRLVGLTLDAWVSVLSRGNHSQILNLKYSRVTKGYKHLAHRTNLLVTREIMWVRAMLRLSDTVYKKVDLILHKNFSFCIRHIHDAQLRTYTSFLFSNFQKCTGNPSILLMKMMTTVDDPLHTHIPYLITNKNYWNIFVTMQ